jgi:2,3,4,5-tetrahydropyridine-2-carboxylate N-succinyltransferase
MTTCFAWGIGIARHSNSGVMLDCYFPAPVLHPSADVGALLREEIGAGIQEIGAARFATLLARLPEPTASALAPLTAAKRALTSVLLEEDGPIVHTAEAYLKLHLLSHRLLQPNAQNLQGIFAHLPTVAWTSAGPILGEELPARLLEAHLEGEHLEVHSVDKFPRMTNYVVPAGIRIADASRVRLGAYLGEGTTVMHEGQVNFNSGTMGPNMVEGRISQGVVMGADSDLGGGASTMGTLSGGGTIRVSLGRHCLIGANAGTGIPLGDRCTIEAGLYITASTPVTVIDETGAVVRTVKARQLAGGSDMLFVRNGLNGQVQCRTNRKAIALNDALHANN